MEPGVGLRVKGNREPGSGPVTVLVLSPLPRGARAAG